MAIMRKIKAKILCGISLVMMSAAMLCGCGSDGKKDESTKAAVTTEAESKDKTEKKTEAAAEEKKEETTEAKKKEADIEIKEVITEAATEEVVTAEASEKGFGSNRRGVLCGRGNRRIL